VTDPTALLVADAADGLVVAHPVHAIARRFPDIAACQTTPRTRNSKRVALDMRYGPGKRNRHLLTGRALPSWTSAENWLLAHRTRELSRGRRSLGALP
jgi:hypothetical protein